jgi:CDP-diacylglycerol--glycerol-3-phosphate 3-phosphatidyltransferase
MAINLANQITLYRLLAGPLFLIFYHIGDTWAKIAALAIVLMAIVTDFIDGYVARNWERPTLIGKMLDPLVDFLFFITIFLCLMVDDWIPLWMVYVLLVRELTMHLLVRPLMLARGISPKARAAGKVKTIFQSIAAVVLVGLSIIVTLQGQEDSVPAAYLRIAYATMLAVVVLSVGSLVPYLIALGGSSKGNGLARDPQQES